MVSSETLPVVALSRGAGGEYVAAARVGAVALTALDLHKADRGTGSVTLTAARQEAALDLRLVAEPPRVTSITPASGATSVALSTAIVAIFSEPIDPATVSGANAGNVLLTGPSGAPIPGTIGLSGGNTLLTFRPVAPLEPDTAHTFTLGAAIADATGQAMGAPFALTFSTLDTTPPPPPPAGSLSASIPEGGFTTVRGTQGTAGLHDTVTIENITRGTSTPVLLDSNGGFLVRVQAAPGDVLKLKIVDQAGHETIVDDPSFTRQNRTAAFPVSSVRPAAMSTVPTAPRSTSPRDRCPTARSSPSRRWTPAIAVAMTPEQKAAFPFAGASGRLRRRAAREIRERLRAAEGGRQGGRSVDRRARDDCPAGSRCSTRSDTAKLIDGRVHVVAAVPRACSPRRLRNLQIDAAGRPGVGDACMPRAATTACG
jgi:hypothetical protein